MRQLNELTEPERRVWEAFPRGYAVDLRTGDKPGEPSDRHGWGRERTVRADVLAALLLGARESEPGHVARLVLEGAHVTGELNLADARVTVPVVLRGCHFDDAITLAGTRTQRFDLSGSSLARLEARQARVDGDLMLRHSQVRGGVEIAGAHINGVLQLNHARLSNPDGYALHAARLMIDHSIYCADFVADGGMMLAGASIGGGLHMLDAHLNSRSGRDALEISRTTIDDDVNLIEGCVVQGLLRMVQAQVRGQIDLSGARLANPDGPAVLADNLTVNQNLLCAGLTSEGELRMLGAHIAGDLVFSGARLENRDGHAVDAGSLKVDRGLRCDQGFRASGAIRLTGAELGVLELFPAEPVPSELDLRHAHVGVLYDDSPASRLSMHLDGLSYDELHPLLSAQDRLDWLGQQPEGYRPLPFEQLARTYRKLGHDADARRVLLAKERRCRAALPAPSRVWGVVQDWTVGYGYLPGRAAGWLLALFALATVLFWIDPPAQIQSGPRFIPAVYALDVLLPVVNLGQERAPSRQLTSSASG